MITISSRELSFATLTSDVRSHSHKAFRLTNMLQGLFWHVAKGQDHNRSMRSQNRALQPHSDADHIATKRYAMAYLKWEVVRYISCRICSKQTSAQLDFSHPTFLSHSLFESHHN